MSVWVCDWTQYQGMPVPVQRIGAEGYGMVKLKVGGSASQSWHYIDPYWIPNAANVMAQNVVLPGAYWYLSPGKMATAQAGLFVNLLDNAGGRQNWAAFVDVENNGLTPDNVFDFWAGWSHLTQNQPLALYTSRSFWTRYMTAATFSGPILFPFLEEAHWVPQPVRFDSQKPYASQHAKAIDPAWWSPGYGGWTNADMLQFTDNALVADRRTCASLFRGTKEDLKRRLIVA